MRFTQLCPAAGGDDLLPTILACIATASEMW
jgi:hypothetical protein